MEYNDFKEVKSFEIYNFNGFELIKIFEILMKPGWRLISYGEDKPLTPFDKDEKSYFIYFTYSDDVVLVSYTGYVKYGVLENINVELSFKYLKEV